jgi:hypothetical protein
MAKEIELRRHTDNDGDVLSADGVQAALEIGARLTGGYDLAVSTGAQRATQTLACFLAALGQKVPGGVLVEPGLRSLVEDRWRAAYERAGSGALEALRNADRELVEEDSAVLGAALRGVLDRLADGERALVVGHSPTNGGCTRPDGARGTASRQGRRRARRCRRGRVQDRERGLIRHRSVTNRRRSLPSRT